jgi:hypothetical protein
MISKPIALCCALASSVFLYLSTLKPAAAAGLVKLAEAGDSEPNGTNTFFQIAQTPTLSENGQVVFYTDLRNNGFLQGWGIFIADGQSVRTVAKSGQPSPDLNGNFYTFNSMVGLNNTSQVFETGLQNSLGGGLDNSGLYRVDTGVLAILARAGQPVPGESAVFRSFSGVTVRINRNGQTAFQAKSSTNSAVILRSAGSSLAAVAWVGQRSPDGNGTLGVMADPSLNNGGTVAFTSLMAATNSSPYAILLNDSTGLSVLLRSGQALPDGSGQFSLFPALDLALNDSNQVAFVANLSGTTAGPIDNLGLYRAERGAVVQLARKSQFVPGGNGRFLDFGGQNYVAINNSGAVAFLADLTGTTGGTTDNAAIYLATSAGIKQVVRKGQQAPDGNGVFSKFGYPALNNNNQIAFVATLSGTKGGTTDNQAICFVDDSLSVKLVIRAGQLFNGKTIATPNFLDGPNYGGLTGLNDNGQIAVWSALNGNNAVFLWSNSDAQNGLKLLSAASLGRDVSVSFQAQAGTTNFLQAAPTPMGPFVDVGQLVLAGSGLISTNFNETGGATNNSRFYRIRQLQ